MKIKLPSEEDEDPVKQVVFYKKPTASDELPKAIPKKELKKVHVVAVLANNIICYSRIHNADFQVGSSPNIR